MDTTCGNCHYLDLNKDQPPCDTCLGYNHWAKEKDCADCVHVDEAETDQRPCRICIGHDHWEKLIAETVSTNKQIEDGGKRLTYESGALREPSTGKGRYDLISPFAIERVINWDPAEDDPEKFEDPLDYAYWHINRFRMGDRGPDHLAAASKYILDVIHQVYARECEDKTTWWFNFKISPFALEKIARWYELGAEKYADRNWEKGMSYTRLMDSGQRHLNRYREGQRGEDHLSAAVWNLFAYIHYECCHMDKFDDTPKYLEAWAFEWDSKKAEEFGKKLAEGFAKGIEAAGGTKVLSPIFPKTVDLSLYPFQLEMYKNFIKPYLISTDATKLPQPDFTNDDFDFSKVSAEVKKSKRAYKIIAVDFDGCLCVNKWPEIGKSNWNAFDELIKRREQGDKVILWTCRGAQRLDQAVEWCKERGLEFDAVNVNLPEIISEFGGIDGRKVLADEYWDDKARKVVAE